MFVPVWLAVRAPGLAAVRASPQTAHGVPEHVQADGENDEKTRRAHPRQLGKPDPETGAKRKIRQPHDDDGRDDVDDRDLCGHRHAARDPDLPSQEIRDDHEFPVSGPEGVDGAVGERESEGKQEARQTAVPPDRPHAVGDFSVQAALKFDDGPGGAAAVRGPGIGDLRCRGLGGCRRWRRQLRRQKRNGGDRHQRNGPGKPAAGGTSGNHGSAPAAPRGTPAVCRRCHERPVPRLAARPSQAIHTITFFQTPQNALLWPRERLRAEAGPTK